LVQAIDRGGYTHRQQAEFINLLLFLLNKESRLKNKNTALLLEIIFVMMFAENGEAVLKKIHPYISGSAIFIP
jgi:hypothetical protein